MPAERRTWFSRRALILRFMVLLLFTTPGLSAQEATPSIPKSASAAVIATNPATRKAPASQPGKPVPSSTKRRAGFLAGAGLAILSLLALAVGLALVRTFKR